MPRRLFLVLVILTAAYRFSLLGRGAQAFVDETLYFTSVKALLQPPVVALQAIPAHYGVPASKRARCECGVTTINAEHAEHAEKARMIPYNRNRPRGGVCV